jgi:hypothetical protein
MAVTQDHDVEKEIADSSDAHPVYRTSDTPPDAGNAHLSESLSHNAEKPSDEGYMHDSKEQTESTQNVPLQQIASIRSTTSKYEHSRANADVEKSSQEISTESELPDPNIITWDSPSDPENPMNWTSLWKLSNIILISALTFVTPLASSMFAPGVPALMVEFESTNTALAGFVVSVYILGFAFGPLFLAPLSEIYGRVPVYHVCNVLFIIFTVACALATNLNMLIGFRFLAGIWGSAVLTNGEFPFSFTLLENGVWDGYGLHTESMG